jgi:probable rRNA maturation factor
MIEIEVEDSRWTASLPHAAGAAREAAVIALAAVKNGSDRAVAILLTNDERMRDLSRRFRGEDRATNVLAFPSPAGTADTLGDIALGYGVCAREAREQAKPLADHLRHLVVHGVLHLTGHDHQRADEAARMEALEVELLGRLGVPDPYAEREDAEDHVQSL